MASIAIATGPMLGEIERNYSSSEAAERDGEHGSVGGRRERDPAGVRLEKEEAGLR